ncbi:MAG: hypothetical protein MZW92_14215 [Comamonadaceae bacterium]|nr:hypothetical protein [Comamonadaceae bacterium]
MRGRPRIAGARVESVLVIPFEDRRPDRPRRRRHVPAVGAVVLAAAQPADRGAPRRAGGGGAVGLHHR